MDALTAPIETGPAAEHFRNGRFFNPGVGERGPRDLLRWIWTRKPGPWRQWIDSTPGPRPPARVDGATLRVTFVNHSTILLQTEGLNILTDPVWSYRVSPFSFAGPTRHRNPGILFDDLPAIDCLLISHNHYDHFDVPTLKRLAAKHEPAVFCPLGLAGKLRRIGFREVEELDWWQARPWRGVSVHCMPAQHFSARSPFDRNRTLWCGWMMECRHGNIYFAGDTGFGDLFGAIRERFPAIRLALLPIGAYEPEWFMGPIHISPEQAVEARAILDARVAIGIHFGTFALADDAETGPVERLRRALQGREDAEQFRLLEEGEGRLIP